MGREIKRVPLDFAWPLHVQWKGYMDPYTSQRCPACDGTGYNPETKHIADNYYQGERWCNAITQDEVDALIERGRLRDFTHEFIAGRGLVPSRPCRRRPVRRCRVMPRRCPAGWTSRSSWGPRSCGGPWRARGWSWSAPCPVPRPPACRASRRGDAAALAWDPRVASLAPTLRPGPRPLRRRPPPVACSCHSGSSGWRYPVIGWYSYVIWLTTYCMASSSVATSPIRPRRRSLLHVRWS